MKPYPKIDTLYERGPDFKVNTDIFRRDEFACIGRWDVTEKIDGMNIRIDFRIDPESGLVLTTVAGRTDRAEIPAALTDALNPLLLDAESQIRDVLKENEVDSITVYGEGFGPKIQSGGYYGDTTQFRAFDVLVNDGRWLSTDEAADTAYRLGFRVVPFWGNLTTDDITDLVEKGEYYSGLGNDRYEGVVIKPEVPLYDRRGNRVVAKLKRKDFA